MLQHRRVVPVVRDAEPVRLHLLLAGQHAAAAAAARRGSWKRRTRRRMPEVAPHALPRSCYDAHAGVEPTGEARRRRRRARLRRALALVGVARVRRVVAVRVVRRAWSVLTVRLAGLRVGRGRACRRACACACTCTHTSTCTDACGTGRAGKEGIRVLAHLRWACRGPWSVRCVSVRRDLCASCEIQAHVRQAAAGDAVWVEVAVEIVAFPATQEEENDGEDEDGTAHASDHTSHNGTRM